MQNIPGYIPRISVEDYRMKYVQELAISVAIYMSDCYVLVASRRQVSGKVS
jgi:hypothetical protein